MGAMKKLYHYWIEEVAKENQRAASSEVQADLILEWLAEEDNIVLFRELLAMEKEDDDGQISIDFPDEVH